MEALHMIDHYAYRIHPFVGFPEAMARCNPIQIADSLGGDPDGFSYYDLSKNWRSTVTYSIRGQNFTTIAIAMAFTMEVVMVSGIKTKMVFSMETMF